MEGQILDHGVPQESVSLSVAIITYNEEHRIRECLLSVHDWVDEVVVLDSFSTDQTEFICRRFEKVHFFQHPFDGHIEQKNRALDLCRSEWILCIDADEQVSTELKESIQNFIHQKLPINGAKIPRLTFHMQRFIRHGGWYPCARYRLVRRGQGCWGGENPHDRLKIEGKGTRLKGDLLHLSFKDLSHQVQTINHFSSIAALARFNRRKSSSILRLLVKPLSKFLECYCLKRGFLDGLPGFIIAVSSSYSSFLKEAKLLELQRMGGDVPSNLSKLYQKKI